MSLARGEDLGGGSADVEIEGGGQEEVPGELAGEGRGQDCVVGLSVAGEVEAFELVPGADRLRLVLPDGPLVLLAFQRKYFLPGEPSDGLKK